MSPFGLALGMGLLRREFDGGIPHPWAEMRRTYTAQPGNANICCV